MTEYTPELGQMAFGAMYGEIKTPDYVTAGIEEIEELLITRYLGLRETQDVYGSDLPMEFYATSNTGYWFDLPEDCPFTLHAYYWGDCDCGFEEWECENHAPHSPECYQSVVEDRTGDEPWEAPEEWVVEIAKEMGLDPHYGLYTHCTCDQPERWRKALEERGYAHTAYCRYASPNFSYKPANFEARWYKHARRGATVNREPSREEWREIKDACIAWIDGQPKPFRVLITGSQEWAPEWFEKVPIKGKSYTATRVRQNYMSIWSPDVDVTILALREARDRAGDRPMVIVNGGANGADKVAALLGEIAPNCEVETHQALWDRQGDTYNRKAGFERNQRMVDSGVDLCLAFYKPGAGNRGTDHCRALAEKAGVPTLILPGA